jgi:hypothetical protein
VGKLEGEQVKVEQTEAPKVSLATDGQELTRMAKSQEEKVQNSQEIPVKAEPTPLPESTSQTEVLAPSTTPAEPILSSSNPSPQAGPEQIPSPVESPQQPPSPGLFDQVKQAVIKQVGVADSESLVGEATDMLLKDAKQAVNYQIRRGMRSIIKDMF